MRQPPDRLAKLALRVLVFAAVANLLSGGIVLFVSANSELPPPEIEGFFRETARAPLNTILKFGGFAWLAGELMFLAWLYRAATKCRLAGTGLPRQAPFWGILNFFIPVWNIFMPAFFLRDLAKGAGRRVYLFDAVFGYGILYVGCIVLEYATAWLTVRDVILPMRSSPEFAENIVFGFIPAGYALKMEYLAVMQNLFVGFLAFHCRGYIRLVNEGFEEIARGREGAAAAGTGWPHAGCTASGRQDEANGFGWPGLDGGGIAAGARREDAN